MTPRQVLLIRESWRSLQPFTEDLNRLYATLEVAVVALERLNDGRLALEPIRPGARPHYYESLGTALLYTVGAGLGSSFTPEVKEAWRTLYQRLAQALQKEEQK